MTIKDLATNLFIKLKLEEEPRLLTIVFSDGEAHIFSATDEWECCGLEEETITIIDEVNKFEKAKLDLQNDIKRLNAEKTRVEKAIKILRGTN